jgi:hypothetical protein
MCVCVSTASRAKALVLALIKLERIKSHRRASDTSMVYVIARNHDTTI